MFESSSETQNVKLKECPKCFKPIIICTRYLSVTNQILANMNKLKSKFSQDKSKVENL